MSNITPLSTRTVSLLIGVLFVLSGTLKVIDSGRFIQTSFSYGMGWISLLSPMIPPTEIVLGLCLIIKVYTKKIALVVFVLTFLFTLVFGYAYFFRGLEDCGCFGDWFKISPTLTLVRNVLIMVGALFVWNKSEHNGIKRAWKVAVLVIIGAFSFAMGGFTVDNSLATTINLKSLKGKKLSETSLKTLNLSKGNYAIFVFSPSCSHCWNSTENIKQIKASGLFDDVIGLGADSRIEDLQHYKESMKPNFEIKILKKEEIERTLGMRVPKLLIIENEIIKQVYEKDDIPCKQLLEHSRR